MKKLFSILGKIVLWIVGIIVLVGVLAYFFFPQELVRKKAEEILTQKLSRQVTVEKSHLSLIKGIVISGVKIMNRTDGPNAGKPFVECKAFYVKYDLLELLKKRFVMEGLVLDSPSIYLTRYKDEKGNVVMNISDLLPAPKAAPAKPAAKTAAKPAPKPAVKKAEPATPPADVVPKISSSSIPIEVTVKELGLKSAKVELIDTATDKFKETYSLHDVRFLITGIDLKNNSPMKINMGFGVSVSELKDGQPSDKAINLDADITGIFTLFDKNGLLNPDGTLKLALANGKLEGLQMYKELVSQGKNLTESAAKYQKEIIDSVAKVKKTAADLQKNKEAAKALGGVSGSVDTAVNAAQKLDKLDMGFLSKAMDIGFLKDSLEFDELSTILRIKDQKVISSNIEMKGKEVGGKGSGYTGFNTVVDYSANLLGNKKYNNNFLTKALSDADGNIVLPFTITGTLSKPKAALGAIDVKAILRAEVEKQLGPDAGILFGGSAGIKDAAKAKVGAVVDKAKAEAQAKLDAEKAALQKKAEEEKQKAEAEAKAKAAAEAQNQLKKAGVKIPKF